MQIRPNDILMVAAVLITLLCTSSPVVGQQEPLVGLQPVEQTVADRGPLSTSLRWVQYGLREPYGFKQLYQLPVGEQNYVRRNAGLWAVFPRSLYITTRDGISPSIPAGTVYYIGGPDEVIPTIIQNQSAYVRVGRIAADRVEESRIEAILIDRRVPTSSIESSGNKGIDPRLFMEAGDDPSTGPNRQDTRQNAIGLEVEDHQFIVRRRWRQVGGALNFLRDEDYRRQCLRAAISSKSADGSRQSKPSIEVENQSD